MKIISDADIESLNIDPSQCVAWAEISLRSKPNVDLPPKTWQHFPGDVFFNTMPCVIPEINRYGVKVVTRHPGQVPSLKSKLLLMDLSNGDTLACMDANWITAMRTGAVAALAAKTYAADFSTAKFAMVGLGEMARSTFKCLDAILDRPYDIYLLRYKDQAEKFVNEFSYCTNATFHIVDTKEELITNTSVLFSCVTVFNEQFMPNPGAYPPGYLLIPVHTKGFQECDSVFDKIFGDDYGHIKGFQYFDRFKSFTEFTDVLLGTKPGRTSPKERIISYNIGLGMHDVWFASKVYDML